MIVPLSFYFFSRILVFQEHDLPLSQLLHTLPFLISFFLPTVVVHSLAFIIGAAYTFWLGARVYGLRNERSRFKVEMLFFAMFALMATLALVLGLLVPIISNSLFYLAYSLSFSIAMISVICALLAFPQLLEDVVEITANAYTSSKLHNVDTEKKLRELQTLMEDDRVFTHEDASLTMVADLLALSTHQLSELVNANYGKNFPRLIREYRIEATKKRLLTEPNTSLLEIGLDAGFKSQSAFYSAFKDLTGLSPGAFRKTNPS